MADKKRNFWKLFGAGVIGACALCCAPLIVPIIVATGITSLTGGLWFGAAVVVIALGSVFFKKLRRSQNCDLHSSCGCKGTPENGTT